MKANDSRFLLVYVPHRFEVLDRDFERYRAAYGWTQQNTDRDAVRERLRQVAADIGFPLLDLTAALRAADHGVLGGPYYHYDEHWNITGHAVAAAELKRFMAKQGWIAAPAAE